jgi:AraC-like DNA-binding protein
MIEPYSRHFVRTGWSEQLPLHLTTIGYSKHQSAITREEGFDGFHWLHTIDGAGEFTVLGRTYRLGPRQGVLLRPNVPHRYHPLTESWSTWYLTFDGALANPITASLELHHMEALNWDEICPLSQIHEQYGEKCRYSFDFAGLNGALEVYTFLTLLKQHGQASGQLSLSREHERLTPVYLLIEEKYSDPGLGLPQMAETLGISPQRLHTLFRRSWGISPYQYLLRFRIQKAKELLLHHRARAVKDVAADVGFQDFSHFVGTFRRVAGMTPTVFRQHYGD